MKKKKIVGIALMVIGLVVFLGAMIAKNRVDQAQGNLSETSGLLGNNPINKTISGSMEKKIEAYYTPIMWAMGGGAVLFVVGLGTLINCRRKKR